MPASCSNSRTETALPEIPQPAILMRRWLARLARGFRYLTLDPSPRLRRLRAELEEARRPPRHLPPLPDSAYPPGAVPLDCSGIPEQGTGCSSEEDGRGC